MVRAKRDRLREQDALGTTSGEGLGEEQRVLLATRISDYLARSEETANRAMAEYSTHEK